MNRIPTEGLKHQFIHLLSPEFYRLNEQNPDRGIETSDFAAILDCPTSLNEQNPDRGIETDDRAPPEGSAWRLNEQNPDRGIETYLEREVWGEDDGLE